LAGDHGIWVLGVVAGGQLMNAGLVETLGTLAAGTTRLDLYAGSSGYFNPGQFFVVELGFADGQKVAQIVQVTGAAAPPPAPAPPPVNQYRVAGLNAGWMGMDADVLSHSGALTPDGAADGHFAVEIAIEGSVELRYVTVYSSDAQGNPSGGQTWTTSGGGYWILGVVAGGQFLHAGQVETLGTLGAGTTRLDLYASSSGYFNPGQAFVIELGFGDGQKVAQVVQVTGGAVPAVPPPAATGPVCAAQGDGVYVPAADGAACSTPYALEAGRTYILEASGTISVWDTNTDRVDAVWCYTPDFCATGLNWEQLQVDGQGLSGYSAAAGGPTPLPYDPSHVYRVYVQGQGRPIQLGVADGLRGSGGDNYGGFTVRIYAAQ
jgi:hypothetical protein